MVRFDKNLWKFTKIVKIRPKLLKFAQNLWNLTKIDEIWPKKMKFEQIDEIWPKLIKFDKNYIYIYEDYRAKTTLVQFLKFQIILEIKVNTFGKI